MLGNFSVCADRRGGLTPGRPCPSRSVSVFRTFPVGTTMMLGPRSVSRIRLGECIRRAKPPPLKRSLHKVVKLPYENREPQVNGLYPLYSKEAFNLAWTEYQGSLIEQVNRLTSGTYPSSVSSLI